MMMIDHAYHCKNCEPDHPDECGCLAGYCDEHRPAPVEAFLTVDGAANELRLTTSQVRRLCGKGLIQGAKISGDDWRIPYPIVRLDD